MPSRTFARSAAKITPNPIASNSLEVEFNRHMHMARDGVGALDGNKLDVPLYSKICREAIADGSVDADLGNFIMSGIAEGFDPLVDECKLQGIVVNKNYPTAFENAEKVTSALRQRVERGKTVRLGSWNGDKRQLSFLGQARVVPLGAVPYKMEPERARPYSDHTKTGFNPAADMSKFKHTLKTPDEIAEHFKPHYYARVEDIEDAFPTLPWKPYVYKYMLVHWYDIDVPLAEQSEPNTLYLHKFGDFGTGPMPGIWDSFVRCTKGMARSQHVLTKPMPHFVDDLTLIGRQRRSTDRDARKLARWLLKLGIVIKAIKTRKAAQLQYVLGLWWNSIERTRTLDKAKLDVYIEHLLSVINSRSITLQELQVLAGQMQRACLTLPPRATVLLANLFYLMHGLTLPWQKRRLTAAARNDLRALADMLMQGGGRGYFSYDLFSRAPWVATDAAADSRRAGGGFFTGDGIFGAWRFGPSDQKKPIDFLEGKAVLIAAEHLCKSWNKKIVPFYIDNSAFQLSFKKGRSRVERLNVVLRELFKLSVKYNCIFEPIWISTHLNIFADALSRGKWKDFYSSVAKIPASAGISLRWCGDFSPPGKDCVLRQQAVGRVNKKWTADCIK